MHVLDSDGGDVYSLHFLLSLFAICIPASGVVTHRLVTSYRIPYCSCCRLIYKWNVDCNKDPDEEKKRKASTSEHQQLKLIQTKHSRHTMQSQMLLFLTSRVCGWLLHVKLNLSLVASFLWTIV